MFKTITTLLFIIICASGCKHKVNFDSLATVHYQADIAPIISSNCTFSGCHGLVNTEKFNLTGYDQLIKNGDVKSGSPEQSNLYQVINTFNKNKIMPASPYSRLNDAQIELIYVWIGQGAKNN